MRRNFSKECHTCRYRHSCCPHPFPKNGDCKHWKLGKCYTCKYVDAKDEEWVKRGCEANCFSGCKNYSRSRKKTQAMIDLKNKASSTGKKFTDEEIIEGLTELSRHTGLQAKYTQALKTSLDLITRQKAEIKRYKRYYYQHEYDKWEKEIKTEAYKEFAEELKKRKELFYYLEFSKIEECAVDATIDNLLKEKLIEID